MRNFCLIIIIISCSISIILCARILAVVPTPSFSHQIVFRPIWEQLAKNGHDLVVLTTDPWQNNSTKPIKQINLNHVYKIWKDDSDIIKQVDDNSLNIFKTFQLFSDLLIRIVENELDHPEVQQLLNNKSEHFDLVIVEYLHPVMFAFSNHFNCPYIGVTSLDLPGVYHSFLGNPDHPLLYPDFNLPYASSLDMTFKERFTNTFVTFLIQIYGLYTNLGPEQQTVDRYFGTNHPSLFEIMKNVSLILMNVNPVFNKRPLGPITVPFGGSVHLQPPKPLPKDLLEFLDGATDGCIYFSFGTNVNENNVNQAMRQLFLNVFQNLPYRILWKFNIDIPNLPENVKITKWIPQQDVLRHRNVKLFITQGGLQSLEEAISCEIPMVIIPFIADQMSNANKMIKRGIGLSIDKSQLNQQLLRETIEEVIKNPKYKIRVREIAELAKDQPVNGVDRAVWWIEYVLRHNGAKHLRNQHAIDIPLYQYFLLDVLLVIFLILVVFFYVFWKISVFVYKKFNFSYRKLKQN